MSIAWNDIATAIIAAFAAGISLFTFVYQYTLKAQLHAQLGREIIVHYTQRGQLILTASFVFLNKGAMPAAMTGLYATIWAGPDRPDEPNLTWRQFEKVERVNALGDPADYRYGSSGAVATLVVPGRGSSSAETIRFYSKASLPLGQGTYSLAFQAVGGSTREAKARELICSLSLNEVDAEVLNTSGEEIEGRVSSRISFEKKLPAPPSRNSLAGRLRSLITPRKTVIEFKSDGKWDATPRPPAIANGPAGDEDHQVL